MIVHAVMVEEGAAGRLAHTDALGHVDPGVGTEPVRQEVRVVEQTLDGLDAGQDLD